MPNFTREKEKLKGQIAQVNEYFEVNSFIELIKECKILMTTVIFAELEQWLFHFLKEDGLEVVAGILAVLYFDLGNKEYALIYAEEAEMFFPGCPIWTAIQDYYDKEEAEEIKDIEARWEALLAELYG